MVVDGDDSVHYENAGTIDLSKIDNVEHIHLSDGIDTINNNNQTFDDIQTLDGGVGNDTLNYTSDKGALHTLDFSEKIINIETVNVDFTGDEGCIL